MNPAKLPVLFALVFFVVGLVAVIHGLVGSNRRRDVADVNENDGSNTGRWVSPPVMIMGWVCLVIGYLIMWSAER